MKEEKDDILDILLDENDRGPIRLTAEDGSKVTFEQVAIIPLDHKLYCILKPMTKIDGVADDEALVFRVDEREDEHVLVVEEDENIAIKVFMEYYDLVDEEHEKNKKGGGDD